MVPLIPLDVLFGNPDRVAPRLSPDGTRLAWLAPLDGVLNVWVKTVGRADDRALTRDAGRGVRQYEWAEDDRHVLYLQDRDGDENWHLHRVPAEGGEPLDLTPIEGVQARLVGTSERRPGEVLVGLNDRDASLHDVWRVDLATGARRLEMRNDVGAVDFVADHSLAVRVAVVPTPDGGFAVLHRPDATSPFAQIYRIAAEDSISSATLGFKADDVTLYAIRSAGEDTASLRAIDTRTGKETVLAGNPLADVENALFCPRTHAPQAVAFAEDRRRWTVLDEAIRADLEALGAAHPGDLLVVSRDRADGRWISAHTQDRGPVVYHAYDRAARRAEFMFVSQSALANQPLAEMRPVRFAARDGLTIHGYLTVPVDATPGPLPAVINVHGGPWHRDSFGYDPEAQWLANRGYACLQVNFRGSTGRGKSFVNAGDREWGGKMQDDITDAARWLVAQGVADPKRLGIYGGSYGGFAVLSGLTKTPDLFACGVDIVGPSNLITFSRSIPPYWEPLRAMFRQRVGDDRTEEEFLMSRSPLFAVSRIRAPLMIVQGRNDPRVKREESLQIKAALEGEGRTVEFLEFDDEGHGFAKPENRLRFYAAAERFLARHLGGRCA